MQFDKHKSESATVSFAGAQKATYLNACINEVMCLHVITQLPHDRINPPTCLVVCSVAVPSGTDIGVHIPVLHYRTEIVGGAVEEF